MPTTALRLMIEFITIDKMIIVLPRSKMVGDNASFILGPHTLNYEDVI